MFDNKYPYTDFSQLNLDWFLLKFKELLEEQERVSGKVKDLDDTVKEFTDFVTNYFDNLDVQAEVNVKLNEMAADGTLSDLLAPLVSADIGGVVAAQIGDVVDSQIDDVVADQIGAVVGDQIGAAVAPKVPGAVTSWLNDNVNPVGSAVIVDDSLTIQGAAADAKTVGDTIVKCVRKIIDIPSTLISPYDDLNTLEFNTVYTFTTSPHPAHTPDGITGISFSVLTFTASQYSTGASQILITSNGKTFTRSNWSDTGWTNWSRLDNQAIDTSTFVQKKHNIMSELIAPYDDLNTVEFNTVYTYSGSPHPAHTPDGLTYIPFSVLTFTASQYTDVGASQLVIASNGKTFTRSNWSGTGWTDWKRCDNEEKETIYPFTDYIKKPLGINSTKSITFYGDSITAGSMGQQTTSNGWTKTLCNKFGVTTSYNRAVSGAAFGASDSQYKLITQMTDDATGLSADYIIIACGTNDYGRAVNLTDFRSAVEEVLTYLENNTSAEVIFITPINRTAAPYSPNSNSLGAYSEIIMCEALTAGHNVLIGKNIGFPSQAGELATTIFADGLHPNQLGHDLMGQNIYNMLKD